MNLEHLERLARAAGYATALDEDEAPFVGARVELKPAAAIRFKTPDAPAPRKVLAVSLPEQPNAARAVVTSAVNQAVRGVQTLIGTRGAHA